ncbi:hypothetical protein NOGI109294_08185 [Nocardiopsis gilva]
MLMSSRSHDRWCGLVARSVTDHRPQHVGAATGQRQQGLLVPLALGSLAPVERPRPGTAREAGQRRQVEHRQQAPVEPARSSQVAAHPSGVTRCGSQPREGRQSVGGAEHGHLAAGRGDELGAEPGTHAGQTLDHLGMTSFPAEAGGSTPRGSSPLRDRRPPRRTNGAARDTAHRSYAEATGPTSNRPHGWTGRHGRAGTPAGALHRVLARAVGRAAPRPAATRRHLPCPAGIRSHPCLTTGVFTEEF